MANSNFDKNGVDNSGMPWLQYAPFVAGSFVIYFDWTFFNDASFQHLAIKILKFWNCNGYNPFNYCVMGWKVEFYP